MKKSENGSKKKIREIPNWEKVTEISGWFFGVYIFIPPKQLKINDYSPEHPFF
jgi:hypothetical protein